MKQFNLSEWLQDKSRKIVTRNGRPVRIVCWDKLGEFPIIACIRYSDDYEDLESYNSNGFKYSCDRENQNDLFFADEEEESQSTEFSFGAFDSEFVRDEYLIPEGCEARIEGNKVIIEKIKEPVSEDLEEAASKYVREDFHERSRADFKAGAEWQKQHLSSSAVLETKVMMDCDGDGIETPYEEWLTLEDTEISYIPDNLGLKEGDKVKIIILKTE